MNTSNLRKARKISSICFITLLFIAVVHGAINTIFLYENRLATSFPLWSAFALVGIFYAIPLFILLSVFLVFSILYARRMRAEKLDSR